MAQQIDLGRAPRALNDHHVEAAAQVGQRGQNLLEQLRLELVILGGSEMPRGPTHHHHLAGPLARGLEQHRVHGHFGHRPRSQGLHPLGPPDLVTRSGHKAVVGHVLGLERRHPNAVAGQEAAQAGDDLALARIGRGPAHHQATAQVRVEQRSHEICPSTAASLSRFASLGTPIRTVFGSPKLAQSRTTIACGARRPRKSPALGTSTQGASAATAW